MKKLIVSARFDSFDLFILLIETVCVVFHFSLLIYD